MVRKAEFTAEGNNETSLDPLQKLVQQELFQAFDGVLERFEQAGHLIFELALKYLSLVKYDTFVFKFDVRTLMLKIYLELGYYEQTRSLIDSFRHFILENTSITEYIKMVHLNFIKFVNEIMRLKESKKEFDPGRLINEITLSQARNKEWLIEKIYELPGTYLKTGNIFR